MNDSELILLLKEVAYKIGRTPNRGELNSLGLPSEIVFSTRFESYGKACDLAEITKNSGITKRELCYSKNGDTCLSNSEKKISDFLIDHNIKFKKDIKYFDITKDKYSGKMTCDWILSDGTLVEYFGMSRHKKYKSTMKRKMKLCKKNNINLISIIDRDLNSLNNIFSNYM